MHFMAFDNNELKCKDPSFSYYWHRVNFISVITAWSRHVRETGHDDGISSQVGSFTEQTTHVAAFEMYFVVYYCKLTAKSETWGNTVSTIDRRDQSVSHGFMSDICSPNINLFNWHNAVTLLLNISQWSRIHLLLEDMRNLTEMY